MQRHLQEPLLSLDRLLSKVTGATPRSTSCDAAATPADSSEMSRAAKPAPRLIRTARDAELTAAEWMRWMGFTNVGVTPVGPDAGIDVFSDEAIAQVKMEGVPTNRAVLQNAFGVAAAERKRALFFSLSGYVKTAVEWAEKPRMPLFTFDLQGEPVSANSYADQLMRHALRSTS